VLNLIERPVVPRGGSKRPDWSGGVGLVRKYLKSLSGGVGLVCGMKRWIIDAATTHGRGSIRSADVNNSNLRIEPMSTNRDRPGDRGRLSDLISPSPSSVWTNQWEEPNVRKHRAHR
jgi:hypothetical protein